VFFYLLRSPCRGYCPSYTVLVHEDGMIEYEGDRCVGTKGHQTAKVSPARVSALARRFQGAGYLDFEYTYFLGGRPDSVQVNSAFRWKSRRRLVNHYHSAKAPKALVRLEDAIDGLALTQRWVPCKSSKDGVCYDCR
jgi:hypothetical protein